MQWAGTKPLKPISSERLIEDKELFGETSLDNVRMRAALRWAAKALNKRSPYEIYPDDQEKSNPSEVASLEKSGEESEAHAHAGVERRSQEIGEPSELKQKQEEKMPTVRGIPL